MRSHVTNHLDECNYCAKYKYNNHAYGHVPPRNDTAAPWDEVAIDTIGPWTVPIQNGHRLQIKALTMVDMATTLSECV
eukprot:scaffold23321_cov107-Amphora_coffeaeformis.AAC.1